MQRTGSIEYVQVVNDVISPQLYFYGLPTVFCREGCFIRCKCNISAKKRCHRDGVVGGG